MADTRRLFADMTSRKASSWDWVPLQTIDDERMRILMGLPMKVVDWATTPLTDFLSEKAAKAQHGCEWIIQRVGEEDIQHFYVNTEGYSYARYAFRFEPRAV